MRPIVYPETIELIVREYEATDAVRAAEVDWWLAEGLPFSVVIERVGRADLFGKRHPHQRRLSTSALEAGTAALHAISDKLKNAPDFYELWKLVQSAYRPIYGLGELAVYDVAERLRYRLRLESAHLIYLHAGARVGARRLAGGRLKRESAWGILRHEVPAGVRHLCTHEIEDILCIYKDELLLTPQDFRARRTGRPVPSCGSKSETRSIC
ncbi:MAG: hypothetical protein H2038_08890 [Brevundimonas sp.]|uniref:hypothetical protein n=1 Tax=Brevundimonas sp. TaxID=1871086 RepID=UPI0017FBB4AD|nr:hypothetical protein [Brevundimonas sp.]MBA4804750.1 hypothetical protein [Brevundimonas sp.]